MKSPRKARGPRPGSIERVAGLSYGDLDAHLGYQLRRAQLAGFEAFHRATERIDITPARYTALTIVSANPGLSQSDLGAALGTARSGAMQVADWLEARRLAERRRREGDGRAWGLHLTQYGRSFLARVKRSVRARDLEFARRLSRSELAQLRRLLEKLSGANGSAQ
jgi:DNA-binding MarR family transcriptional regulator